MPDGRQVLTAGLTALFFDADGNFLRIEERLAPAAARAPENSWPRPDPACASALADAVGAWHSELQLLLRPIRVRRFNVPVGDVEVGIDDHLIADLNEADLD